MHRTRRPIAVAGTLGALVLAAATLSGCAPVVRSCPSWADFSDPDAAYRQADVVVVGHVAGRDGTIGTALGDVRAYRFEVEDAVKGSASGTVVRIGSRADPCDGGDGYVSGDALASAADRVIVYAMNDTGGLVTLTPSQGVTALPDGAPLPFEH